MTGKKIDKLTSKLTEHLVNVYGHEVGMGPKILNLVARIAVIEGWVSDDSLKSFDTSKRDLLTGKKTKSGPDKRRMKKALREIIEGK